MLMKLIIEGNSFTELKQELEEQLAQMNSGVQQPYEKQAQTTPVTQQPPLPDPQTSPMMSTQPPAATLPVPTQKPTYTHEQLAVAAANLVEANPAMGTQLPLLLQQYGAQSLTQIPVEQLGAVAQSLRQLGGNV